MKDANEPAGNLAPWEALVVDAVGAIIEFWNFKRNQGRVWALLYLRGANMTAPELQAALGLSKGAVSMIIRDLEHWGVVRRVRGTQESTWRYAPETNLMQMIGGVLREREHRLVTSVRTDLERAARMAKEARADHDVQQRLERMSRLAAMVDQALEAFLSTASLDARFARDAFAVVGAEVRARSTRVVNDLVEKAKRVRRGS